LNKRIKIIFLTFGVVLQLLDCHWQDDLFYDYSRVCRNVYKFMFVHVDCSQVRYAKIPRKKEKGNEV